MIYELHNTQIARFCSSHMMFVILFFILIVLLGNLQFNLKTFSPLAANMHFDNMWCFLSPFQDAWSEPFGLDANLLNSARQLLLK